MELLLAYTFFFVGIVKQWILASREQNTIVVVRRLKIADLMVAASTQNSLPLLRKEGNLLLKDI